MAQNREKDETLDLKVPSETPLSLSCPDNCNKKIPSLSTRVDPDPDPARPRSGPTQDGQSQRQDGGGQAQDKVVGTNETVTFEGIQEITVTVTVKKTVKRCSCCGKRVGLTGFRCRCGDLFCGVHRYSDRHDCSYDYKAAGREAIAKENPVVRASKILKV